MHPRTTRRLARLAVPAVLGVGLAATAAPGIANAHATAEHVAVAFKNAHLTVTGTNHADKIALRLAAADPSILEVDTNDDGVADYKAKVKDVKRIRVDAKGGDDRVRIDESAVPFAVSVPIVLDGGAGADDMRGGQSVETYKGGAGNDFVDGNRGNDRGEMGAGDDVFQWDPGDGNDTIEGQAGPRDKLLFNGAGADETVDITANGKRVKFFRQPGPVIMDLDDVEAIRFNALGGKDTVNVGDLSGTDAKRIDADLAGAPGAKKGDGATDTIKVTGTAAADRMKVSGSHGAVLLQGLPATVAIANAERYDQLVVNGKGGHDVLDASKLAPGTIKLKFIQ